MRMATQIKKMMKRNIELIQMLSMLSNQPREKEKWELN
jgi:hypothetical protein